MTTTEIRELDPFARSVEVAKLGGAERGRYDAEAIASFLGSAATSSSHRHNIYNLRNDYEAEAHGALVESLGIPAPDFNGVEPETPVLESLGFGGRLVRHLIVEESTQTRERVPIAYYVSAATPFPERIAA